MSPRVTVVLSRRPSRKRNSISHLARTRGIELGAGHEQAMVDSTIAEHSNPVFAANRSTSSGVAESGSTPAIAWPTAAASARAGKSGVSLLFTGSSGPNRV